MAVCEPTATAFAGVTYAFRVPRLSESGHSVSFVFFRFFFLSSGLFLLLTTSQTTRSSVSSFVCSSCFSPSSNAQVGKGEKSSLISPEVPSYLLSFFFSFSFRFSFRLGRPRPPSVGTRTQQTIPTEKRGGGRIAQKAAVPSVFAVTTLLQRVTESCPHGETEN